MKEELKPCPFCGEDNLEIIVYSLGCFVLCPGCGVATVNRPTKKEAADVWNRRVPQ